MLIIIQIIAGIIFFNLNTLLSVIIRWIKYLIIKRQIKNIKSNGVVLRNLPKGEFYDYDNCLLLSYPKCDVYTLLNPFAILTKNSTQPKIYTFTIPLICSYKDTNSVELDYFSQIYPVDDVSNIESVIRHGVKNNYKLTTAQQLAPIIKQHLQIKSEIGELRQRDIKICNLAKLVAASDIYNERLQLYETDLRKIRNCLKQAKQLDQLYARLVREMLIGIKVAEEEFQHLPGWETSFDLQYQRIQEEYNFMKDEATAYYQLLKDSRYTQV